MSDKKIEVENSNSDSFWLVFLIVLFWNFGDNKYDLYDLIYQALLKYLGGVS